MISTSRLVIFPLSYNQLLAYIKEHHILEDELGLTPNGRKISGEMKDMLVNFILPEMRIATAKNYLFYTIWIVVNKLTNSIVAEIGFKGEPDENGKVEIGYGTLPFERCKGYMTETVSGMIEWCAGRTDIKTMTAETDINNQASIRVMEKNGFTLYNTSNDMLYWRRSLL